MFILLSYLIDKNTPMYGGQKGFFLKESSSISNGKSANTSHWQLPSHLGTHIDFPRHFYNNGQTIEDFDLDFWVFKNRKIQLLEVKSNKNDYLIKPQDIMKSQFNKEAELILIKTGFGKYRIKRKYWEKNPGISHELADWIKNIFKNAKIIGIDCISISSYQNREIGREVHKKILDPKDPILLVEDMDLSKINKHTEFKSILITPLMIKSADGCPCTIIADVK